MDLLHWLETWLEEHGYEGLSDGECSCELGDLAPCGWLKETCMPAREAAEVERR